MTSQCSVCDECKMSQLVKFLCDQAKKGMDIMAIAGNCSSDEFKETVMAMPIKEKIQLMLAGEFFSVIDPLLCKGMLSELGWTEDIVCLKKSMH